MRGHGFPWSKLLMVLLVFAAGFIAHDVRSHGSFTGLTLVDFTFMDMFMVFRCYCVVAVTRTLVIKVLYVFCISDSTAARYLRNSGLTAVSQQAWSKITVYSKQGFRYDLTHLHSSSTHNMDVKQAIEEYALC